MVCVYNMTHQTYEQFLLGKVQSTSQYTYLTFEIAVIACEFRDVGCFLLPVVSVIRSLLFTNESRGLDVIVNLHVQRIKAARHAAQIKTTVFRLIFPRGEKVGVFRKPFKE